MMLVLSLLLLTVWLGAVALDAPMGGSVHVLGITAVLIVLLRKSPRERRAAGEGSRRIASRRLSARPVLASRTRRIPLRVSRATGPFAPQGPDDSLPLRAS